MIFTIHPKKHHFARLIGYGLLILSLCTFLLTSCSTKDKIKEQKSKSSGLMAKLETANNLRDTLLYATLKKTIEDEIKKGDVQLKLYYQTHQANRYASEGEFEKAEKLLKETIEEAYKVKEYFSVASCYGTLGRIAFFNNDKDQAIAYWKKSVAVAEK